MAACKALSISERLLSLRRRQQLPRPKLMRPESLSKRRCNSSNLDNRHLSPWDRDSNESTHNYTRPLSTAGHTTTQSRMMTCTDHIEKTQPQKVTRPTNIITSIMCFSEQLFSSLLRSALYTHSHDESRIRMAVDESGHTNTQKARTPIHT